MESQSLFIKLIILANTDIIFIILAGIKPLH